MKERIEMELAGELNELIALGWTDEEVKNDPRAFLNNIDDYYMDQLAEEDIWRVWRYVWDERKADVIYRIKDGVDISLLGDHVTEDMLFTRAEVEEDAANFEMSVEDYINRFLLVV